MSIDSFVIVKARKLPESDGVYPENRHQSKKSRGQNGAPRRTEIHNMSKL